ncbi:MAG: class I tRNA ligase family protein, partial [Thermoleophilia bacterium]|nr:class I tRNA ligase family protein [Thermoleophilia bacterium]
LAAVIREISALYDSYDFAEAARLIYRFVWNEICDWYLEVVKPRLYSEDEQERLQVSGTLLALFERVMGLLHPIMPFVSEEIYRNLRAVGAEDDAGSRNGLLESAFPQADARWVDPVSERAMEAFVAVVAGLRSARDELEVPRDVVGRVWLVSAEESALAALLGEPRSFRLLAGSEIVGSTERREDVPPGRYATVEGPGVMALLDLAGFADVERERDRLLLKAGKARAEIARARAKLANQGFIAKAPADVVEQERERLGQAEALLADIGRHYRERVGEDLPR